MNKVFLTLIFATFSFYVFGQDTVMKLSGEKVICKINKSFTNKIEFSYPNETALNVLPKSLIQYIIYSSGRKEEVNSLIDISGEEGWKKVQVTFNPEDVEGLVKLGEIRAKSNNAFSFNDVSGVDKKASEKIQKEASGLGAHVILLLQNSTKGVSYGSAAQSFKSGVAYGYPFKTLSDSTDFNGELGRRFYGKQTGAKKDPGEATGSKVLFEYEGEVFEGVIKSRYGNFYKVKYINKNGKENVISRHIDKVEFPNK